MKTKITYKDNKGYYTKISKEFEGFIEGQIDTAVTNIEAEAVAAAPVKLGFLRGSSQHEAVGLEGVVRFTADYSPYIEFGTGGSVDVPAGLEDYAIQFKGAGIRQVNLTPRPYLFPAFKAETTKMLERIDKKINGDK